MGESRRYDWWESQSNQSHYKKDSGALLVSEADMDSFWLSLRKWIILKQLRKATRRAIVSCGFTTKKDSHWCTICREKVHTIHESHTTYSGESFAIKVVATTCFRCRWIQYGEPATCDDRYHPPLLDFLKRHGLSDGLSPLQLSAHQQDGDHLTQL